MGVFHQSLAQLWLQRRASVSRLCCYYRPGSLPPPPPSPPPPTPHPSPLIASSCPHGRHSGRRYLRQITGRMNLHRETTLGLTAARRPAPGALHSPRFCRRLSDFWLAGWRRRTAADVGRMPAYLARRLLVACSRSAPSSSAAAAAASAVTARKYDKQRAGRQEKYTKLPPGWTAARRGVVEGGRKGE